MLSELFRCCVSIIPANLHAKTMDFILAANGPGSQSSTQHTAVAVLMAEFVFFGKKSSRKVVASIVLVCVGVGLSTVTDTHMGSQASGWLVGLGAIIATAAYQIWAGTKQKELQVGSMALLEQYSPLAAIMLSIMVPIFEPLGTQTRKPDTLLG